MMPPNSTGPRIADTQNHLVRTRSTNSRRITAQTLCTHPPIIAAGGCSGRRLWADEIDENLMERGSRQLKTRESRAGIDERLEDLLGVGARGELELRFLANVLDLRDEPAVRADLARAPLPR